MALNYLIYDTIKNMKLNKLSKNIHIASLILLFIYETITSYGKMLFSIDFHREAFFPSCILNGQVLYKDIFNIFGAFPYYINASLYRLFGQNLKTLYVAGIMNTLIILMFTYLISRRFLSRSLSCAIVAFTTFCAFYPSLMNYITPYSYAITYGYSAFLISVFFFLKYLDKTQYTSLWTATFFAGIAVACKYEFIFYPLVTFVFLWIKKHKEDSLLWK